MTDLRKAAEMALEALETHVPHVYKDRGYEPIQALRQALAQPEQEPVAGMFEEKLPDQNPPPWARDYKPKREWVGLSSLDKTFLRTAYAQLRPLYHDKKEDVSVAAEVVTDWDGFFAAINDMLKEKNIG